MNTKSVLMCILMIGIVAVGAGAGTLAYFSDTETSSGNTFTAGTVDLTLAESGGAPIILTNMKPGDSASGTITVTNVGTLPGSLYASSWYVENDGVTTAPDGTGADMTAGQVADMLLITAFTADGANMLPAIPDVNADGRKTVWDMVNDPSGGSLVGYANPPGGHGWYSYDANMASSASHVYVLTVQFDTAAGNAYQGDGITLTFEFLLTQQ